MAEIYHDDATKGVALGVTNATSVSAVLQRPGQDDITGTVASGIVGIPYAIVAYDGPFKVYWTYTVSSVQYNRTDVHEVVTPYASTDELAALPGLDTKSTAELISMERVVRKIIDNYCHQSFGMYKTQYKVWGQDNKVLSMPKPLLELTEITLNGIDLDESALQISDDGWYVGKNPTVWDNNTVTMTVISDPWDATYTFKRGHQYLINGIWGYYSVPTEVNEAAKILVANYFCPESEFRDRYLNSININNWDIEYNSGAFIGTGNVRADQLLDPFVCSGAVVI